MYHSQSMLWEKKDQSCCPEQGDFATQHQLFMCTCSISKGLGKLSSQSYVRSKLIPVLNFPGKEESETSLSIRQARIQVFL